MAGWCLADDDQVRSTSPLPRALIAFVLLLGVAVIGPMSATPAGAATGTSITSIAAGPLDTCAVTVAGAAKCWGSNYYGQLGNGTNDDSLTPVSVTGLTTTAASISVGNAHACAVTTAGAAKCWGQNSTGQLGNNSVTDSSTPVSVAGLSSGVAAIAAGFDYSCAVLTSGVVKCWGANDFGQLGNGTQDASLTPVTVTGLTGASKIAVSSAQLSHSCALTTAGAMACWGNNGDGELGDGTDNLHTTFITPTGMGSNVKDMDVGNSHTCSVTTAGAALCWGFGGQGQLGNDRTFDRYLPEPVTGLSSGVGSISGGVDHSCAVLTTGGVKCWGYNVDGELGDGTTNGSIVPVSTYGLSSGMTSVSAGGYHTCGVSTAGAAKCWGGNGYGQLGDGTTNGSLVPMVVPSFTGGSTAPAMLRVTTSPAVPSQITVDGTIADTWGLQWVKVPAGAHQVCFTSVAGYTTPACQSLTATAGATSSVVGTFVPRGYLQVSTSPAVAGRISVDGVGRDNWGLFTDLATGSHQVCFGAVAGYTPPACQTVTVTAGATTPVTGTYTASAATGLANVGYLRATTTPALPAQLTVDGTIADTWGLNWLEIAPGSHTVCFSHVQGYTEPSCSTVTVTAGATTVVSGTFTQRGFLKVSTSPALAATISVDDAPADDWGVFTDLPPGSHHVCFGTVTGKTAPACQYATVTAGNTTNLTGSYT